VKVSVCTDKQSSCCIELNGNTDHALIKQEECFAVIQAKRAWHDDQTEHDSFGIVVTYWGKSKQPKVIGILGDSKYHEVLPPGALSSPITDLISSLMIQK
jgi:hypothetical protein